MKSKSKQLVGRVVSDKMDKTIIVEIENIVMHSLYKKSVRRSKRVKSHDKDNQSAIGDKVRLEETRPLSKEKRYRLVEIIEKAK